MPICRIPEWFHANYASEQYSPFVTLLLPWTSEYPALLFLQIFSQRVWTKPLCFNKNTATEEVRGHSHLFVAALPGENSVLKGATTNFKTYNPYLKKSQTYLGSKQAPKNFKPGRKKILRCRSCHVLAPDSAGEVPGESGMGCQHSHQQSCSFCCPAPLWMLGGTCGILPQLKHQSWGFFAPFLSSCSYTDYVSAWKCLDLLYNKTSSISDT